MNCYPMVGRVLHGEINRTMIDSLHLPALRGGLFALLAAALFGISTPLVQKLGAGLGAFTTAALLYAGAALIGALSLRSAAHEARVQRSDIPRLLAMAGFGAALGPVAGNIVALCAAVGCLGSLGGWTLLVGQTAKAAAHFPCHII